MKKHILSRYSEKNNDGIVQFKKHGITELTRSVESSDPDEFIASEILNCYEGDFDSILLI